MANEEKVGQDHDSPVRPMSERVQLTACRCIDRGVAENVTHPASGPANSLLGARFPETHCRDAAVIGLL